MSSASLTSLKSFKDAAATGRDDMWTFGRRIVVGFMFPLLLLLGIGAVAYRSISSLTGTNHLVAHTQQVLGDIAEVLSLVKDTETGQRGYIITGEESFLQPFQAAVAGVPTV